VGSGGWGGCAWPTRGQIAGVLSSRIALLELAQGGLEAPAVRGRSALDSRIAGPQRADRSSRRFGQPGAVPPWGLAHRQRLAHGVENSATRSR